MKWFKPSWKNVGNFAATLRGWITSLVCTTPCWLTFCLWRTDPTYAEALKPGRFCAFEEPLLEDRITKMDGALVPASRIISRLSLTKQFSLIYIFSFNIIFTCLHVFIPRHMFFHRFFSPGAGPDGIEVVARRGADPGVHRWSHEGRQWRLCHRRHHEGPETPGLISDVNVDQCRSMSHFFRISIANIA